MSQKRLLKILQKDQNKLFAKLSLKIKYLQNYTLIFFQFEMI